MGSIAVVNGGGDEGEEVCPYSGISIPCRCFRIAILTSHTDAALASIATGDFTVLSDRIEGEGLGLFGAVPASLV